MHLRQPGTLPPLHTLDVQRAQTDPALYGGDWVPTWMETWLPGYCAQPQVPISTKGSSVEHPSADSSSTCLCLVPWSRGSEHRACSEEEGTRAPTRHSQMHPAI